MKKSTEEQVKQGIDVLFSGILSARKKETEKNPIYEQIINKPECILQPRYFDYFTKLGSNIDAVELAIDKVMSIQDHTQSLIYKYIVTHYSVVESHIRKLVTQFEGSSCCADKSNFIIGRYVKFVQTQKPDVDWNKDNYWVPGFGTEEQWFDLLHGIAFLQYGTPLKYLTAYQILINEGVAAYPQAEES